MATESEVTPEETKPEVTEQTANQEQATEKPVEQQETTETKTEETQVEAPKKWKIKHDGKEVELEESELIENAQKGFDYSRKTQSLAELEKANSQKLQLFDQLTQNPVLWKMAMAQNMGYDPALVTANPQQPDPSLESYNPVLYGRQMSEYEQQIRGKQAVDIALQNYINQATAVNNNALFEKGKIVHNLNDAENQQVVGFMQQQMRPNQMGMYSEQQLEYAVNAVLGKGRISEAKLKTTENIQQIIKKAVTGAPPASTKTKTEEPAQTKAREHLEYVKSLQKGG